MADDPLANLGALFGASPMPGAPAFQPSAPAPAADPSGFGNILATLRSAQQSTPNPYGQNTLTSSMGNIPDVRGKSAGSAFLTGISAGIANRQQAAQQAAANNLAMMKMQWDHQDKQTEMKRQQQVADADIAYKKSLAAKTDIDAKKTQNDIDNPAKSADWNPKSITEAMINLQAWSHYDPQGAAWKKMADADKIASWNKFSTGYKKAFGVDYPLDKDGNPVTPPPLPAGAAKKSGKTGDDEGEDTPATPGAPSSAASPAAPANPAAPSAPGAITPTPAAAPSVPQPDSNGLIHYTTPDGVPKSWNPATGETMPYAGTTPPAPPLSVPNAPDATQPDLSSNGG